MVKLRIGLHPVLLTVVMAVVMACGNESLPNVGLGGTSGEPMLGTTTQHIAGSQTGASADVGTSSGPSDDGTGAAASTGASDTVGTSTGPDDGAAAEPGVRVDPGPTKDAELVSTLPVGKSEDEAIRRVVLRLEPSDLPDLALGDVLITPLEVQVTTRCDIGQTAPGCDYNPKIRAHLMLTDDPQDVDVEGVESEPLSHAQTQTCTKNEHHCMFVFRPGVATSVLQDRFALPCIESGTCHVNLVMWAWHPDARSGGLDTVLVGGNEGNYLENGVVEGDKARLMVVRERAIEEEDRDARETSGGGALAVPTTAAETLVYSHPLQVDRSGLRAGEQFLVEVKIVTSVNSRARFSTKLFLTKNPADTGGGGVDEIAPQQIGEHNGINCTPDNSPCVTRKVAVFRVTQDIDRPVYLNVMAKSAVPGGGNATVTVHRNDGWVRSIRYDAALDG